ncbi:MULTISPECIES: type II secretion system protein [unclassified Sedimentibacter]|uniref:type II secretion system protein n=1 Tax=unclassified Sedimentibacter TaxID=2649220 RepID=UPI0027DF4D86|nr:prepilin-type N-terminal cleavage/methylation domain-containing protein [Sedimentibacter sp. MB35-C1]WMJ78072.1 prepilin-type N-terminal cleavage/methylation domain-containing protein [Sedimentibacter sp. MB35-C1]
MNNKGFTLIEVIVVLSILGIISLIAITRFLTISENVRRDVCEASRVELHMKYILLRMINRILMLILMPS